MKSTVPIRVIKVGGSLLSWPPLSNAFFRWIHQQPRMATVVLVGGGPSVENLRAQHQTSAKIAHWQAIDLMSENASQFARITNLLGWSGDLEALPARFSASHDNGDSAECCLVLSSVRRLVEQLDRWPNLQPLPESWQITSDSIAAQLGLAIGCDVLVLLKSCDVDDRVGNRPAQIVKNPATGAWLRQLAERQVVDSYFPTVAIGLKVQLANLRRYEDGSVPDVDAAAAER